MEEDKEAGDDLAIGAAIRSAKKASRPTKIGLPDPKQMKTSKRKSRKVTSKSGNVFGQEMGRKAVSSEGIRAKRGDSIGRVGKKKRG